MPEPAAPEPAAPELTEPVPAESGPTGPEPPETAPAPPQPLPTVPATPAVSSALTTLVAAEAAAAKPAVARWVATVFVVGGVAVLPWTLYLALSLPRTSQAEYYRTAWVGFDLFLAWMLFRIGWIAGRGPKVDDRVELPATAAATLLVVDAWFDVTTSADTGSLLVAVGFAVAGELPMAAVCFWIARHAEEIRRRRLLLVEMLEAEEQAEQQAGQQPAQQPAQQGKVPGGGALSADTLGP